MEISIFVSKNESCFNLLFEKKRDEKIAQHLNSIIYHNRMFFLLTCQKCCYINSSTRSNWVCIRAWGSSLFWYLFFSFAVHVSHHKCPSCNCSIFVFFLFWVSFHHNRLSIFVSVQSHQAFQIKLHFSRLNAILCQILILLFFHFFWA